MTASPAPPPGTPLPLSISPLPATFELPRLTIWPASGPGGQSREFWDDSTSREARHVVYLLHAMDPLVRAVAQGDLVHFARSRTGWRDVPETGAVWSPIEDVEGPFEVRVGPGSDPTSTVRSALGDSLIASVMGA